ncbi:ArnT family glycosyltransferase [Croceitalea rosinachiae]|uniref:Glycosyltransferase family 39 protein n=1 Tax=Croceitalea rosinachiae TaxID=3075596 RepID=A0ABU3A9D5_9FLAO|nr:glycosyltransferase family 39 protein [Croceitalea sp. F388]MDT0606569.1 glycosyltransferase family 39 protein [Croceitalea sp. F388]
MLKKVIVPFTEFYHNFRNWQLFLLLFTISFLVRFPFFFRDYVDRDESTFILMAQSWVDGYLPYIQLWDLKPPVTFLFFAAIIYTFGKSFLVIRIAGVFMVTITSFVTYKIGLRLGYKKVAFWSAIALIPLQSLFGSLQGVMSEHISTAFFITGLYWMLYKARNLSYLITGIFFGLALMTKLNMAYAVLFLFLMEFWYGYRSGNVLKSVTKLAVIGTFILFVILLTALPYYFKGEDNIWWKSVFEAPMAYSSGQNHSIIKVLPFIIIITGFFLVAVKKKLLDFTNIKIQLLVAATLGILISFLQAGKVNGHYLIQLYPSLVLLVGLTLYQLKFLWGINYKPYVLLFCFLLPVETYLELGNIIRNKANKGSFFNGEGIDVPNYFKEKQIKTKHLFFTEYHIGYWLLDSKPPTKAATHPSTILRDNLFPFMDNPRKTAADELQFIIEEHQPDYIITRKNRRVFDKKKYTANFYINLRLLENYTPLDTIDNAVIHRRLKIE